MLGRAIERKESIEKKAHKLKEKGTEIRETLEASEDAKAIKERASDFQEATGSMLTEVGIVLKEMSLKFLARVTKSLHKELAKENIKLRDAIETTQAAKAKRRKETGA